MASASNGAPIMIRFAANSSIAASRREFHFSKYYFSVGHNDVAGYDPNTRRMSRTRTCSPAPTSCAARSGFGDANRRGWNGVYTMSYDIRQGSTQFMAGQATYNTDCCGFSFQWRRFTFGTLNDNQFRLAFTIANVGSFGTLKKQERLILSATNYHFLVRHGVNNIVHANADSQRREFLRISRIIRQFPRIADI